MQIMVILVDMVKAKEESAKEYDLLSDIIKKEAGESGLKISAPYPGQIPLFYFYKSVFGRIFLGMDLEPLVVYGGPEYPHIKLRNNNYLDFAKRIAEGYEKETSREMTIEYASKK